MTKDEALKVLDTIPTIGEQVDALEMAIEALKQEPCDNATLKDIFCMGCEYKEQEPCEDCISREAVEEITWKEPSYTDALNVLAEVRDKVRQLPPVTPQPKTSRWIRFKEFEHGYYHLKCSECGQYWSVDGHAKTFKYCFNCGAKMIEYY